MDLINDFKIASSIYSAILFFIVSAVLTSKVNFFGFQFMKIDKG